VAWLYEQGARAGASMALAHAAQFGRLAVARWLVGNAGADLAWKNWQDKTALTLAAEAGHAELADWLRQHEAAG
jgi:ankyrin repeat protein